MDDLLGKFLCGQRAFAERVHAVGAGEWTLSTPNTAWTVTDLVGHLVYEHRWTPPLLDGLDLDASAKIVDSARVVPADGSAGAIYAQAWDEASAASADAFSADGALDRTVSLARGDTPARVYLHEMLLDLVVHAWDLGRAIGFAGELPADVVEAVWDESRSYGDLSSSGMFDSPVDVDADAPIIDQLVAMTGRDPS